MLNELTKMKMPYRSKIHVYVKRRSVLRNKYGIKSPKFKKHSRTINLKLSTWRRHIKRIEEWEYKLKEIDTVIIDFIGMSAKNTGHYGTGEKWMAKHFMCRYAKDKGIPAIFIRAYIGLHGENAVGDARMRLIRRSAKDDELRNTWKNFKATINAA